MSISETAKRAQRQSLQPSQEALAWWSKWGEQIIHGAVDRGRAKYWADSQRQYEAFREWEQSGYAGDCRQCTNGSLVDYITRSVIALGKARPECGCSGDCGAAPEGPMHNCPHY